MQTTRSVSPVREKKARGARRPTKGSTRPQTSGSNPPLRMGPDARRELVSHPMHYGGDTPHEVIKCLEAWGLEFDALLWNAAKDIARAGRKGDSLTDLKKAAFYLDRRIVQLQSANAAKSQPANDPPVERQTQQRKTR